MNVYARQKQTQIQKTNLWLPKGREKGEGQIRGMGLTDIVQTTVYKIDKQQGYTV